MASLAWGSVREGVDEGHQGFAVFSILEEGDLISKLVSERTESDLLPYFCAIEGPQN